MIYAKKSLGQHFLKSKGALRTICRAGEVSRNDTVLEIGPGKGVLTAELLSNGAHVVAIEKDEQLIEMLKEKFSNEIGAGRLDLISGDILNFDPTNIPFLENALREYKLIANIPYYITGAIIKKFLTEKFQPKMMVLLVQKEVGKRIVARDGKESILSVSVKAYGAPSYVETVQKKYFSPPPKVDSAIVKIDAISKNYFTGFSEEEFFKVIHAGFAHKRKQLFKNLVDGLSLQGEIVEKMFDDLNLSRTIRAEDVGFDLWHNITAHINTLSILNRTRN